MTQEAIDKKLKEILAQPHQNSMGETVMTFITDKTVEQIRQCFRDEGWRQPAKTIAEEMNIYDQKQIEKMAMIAQMRTYGIKE